MKASAGFLRFCNLADPEPKTVIIAGLGPGSEVEGMRARWPNAKFVAVEPLGGYYRQWQSQGFPGVLLQAALWSVAGPLTLHCNYGQDQRASPYPLIATLPHEHTTVVDAITLDDLLAQTGPWDDALLWLDAEGAEAEILAGLSDWSGIRWVNVEVSCAAGRPTPMWRDVDRVLAGVDLYCVGVHSVARDGRSLDVAYVRRHQWRVLQRRLSEESVARKRWRYERHVAMAAHRARRAIKGRLRRRRSIRRWREERRRWKAGRAERVKARQGGGE